jgi:hypothetical protein
MQRILGRAFICCVLTSISWLSFAFAENDPALVKIPEGVWYGEAADGAIVRIELSTPGVAEIDTWTELNPDSGSLKLSCLQITREAEVRYLGERILLIRKFDGSFSIDEIAITSLGGLSYWQSRASSTEGMTLNLALKAADPRQGGEPVLLVAAGNDLLPKRRCGP